MDDVIRRINARPSINLSGPGWWWEYVTRLVQFYPSFTREFVLDELAMLEGWLWYSQAIDMNGWLAFNGYHVISDGYVKQQADLLVRVAHDEWGKS